MSNIIELQKSLISDFIDISDQDKYIHLIELGKAMKSIPVQYKIDENLMPNCQSKVWVYVKNVDGIVKLFVDADSLIMKGIIALIFELLNNRKVEEVKDFDENIFDKIGVTRILSPVRGLGLKSIINYIKEQVA